MAMRRVLLAALLALSSRAEVIPISGQGYPYLYLSPAAAGGQQQQQQPSPARWWDGSLALRMATSSSVRINGRGVRFISASHSTLAVYGDAAEAPAIGGARGWARIRCVPDADSLCRVVGTPSRALPSSGASYASPLPPAGSSNASDAVRSLQDAVGGDCPDSYTGRTFVAWAGGGVDEASPPRWDVSSCNILGGGADLLFLPYRGELYALARPIPLQVVLALSILTMIMAIVLAHNLEFTLGTTKSPTRTATTLVAMVSLLFSAIFASGEPWDVLQPYVTLEDRLACVAVLVYVGYYSSKLSAEMAAHYYRSRIRAPKLVTTGFVSSPVNPVLGTLSMVAMRLYSTMDNPYTVGILFLLATRLLHKIALRHAGAPATREGDRAQESAWFIESADIVADASLASVYIYAGVAPQYGNDPTVVSLAMLQGGYAALTLSRIMAGLAKSRR